MSSASKHTPSFGCRVGTVNEPAIQNLLVLLLQFNDTKDRLDMLNARLADPIPPERASSMVFGNIKLPSQTSPTDTSNRGNKVFTTPAAKSVDKIIENKERREMIQTPYIYQAKNT